MTAYTEHRVIIIPATMQERANAVGHILDPDTGGARSFIVGLSASGPATHYVCSTLYTEPTAALLDNPDATQMHAALQQLAIARNREYTLTLNQIQELRDVMLLSPLPLAEVMANEGLQFVQEDDL